MTTWRPWPWPWAWLWSWPRWPLDHCYEDHDDLEEHFPLEGEKFIFPSSQEQPAAFVWYEPEREVSSFGFKFFSLWIWMCDHAHCNCHKVSSFMTLVEPNGFLFHIWLCVCVSPSHASSRLNFGCKFCDLARCWLGRGHHSRGVTPNRHFWIIFLFVLLFVLLFVVWSIIVFAQC